MKTTDKIKCRRDYMTAGSPSVGGVQAVAPERVRVLRRAEGLPDYWIVRFMDRAGGCVAMPSENLVAIDR